MGRGFATFVLLILAATFAAAGGAPAAAQEAGAEKPNIVFVMTDDLDKASLEKMPNIKSLMADQGATFDNYYVSEALCCPSRSTYLLGEYVHNHGVGGNNPPSGGYQTFHKRGHERRTIAVRLKQGGYATGLFGKYMNGYGEDRGYTRHVPPGWDKWFAKFNQKRYEWYANADGTVRYFGTKPRDYSDDVIGKRARGFVQNNVSGGPFLAYVTPNAPHGPYVDPPDHQKEFAGEVAPRNPNFNEANVSDKPSFVRDNPSLTARSKKYIDSSYRHRLRMLLAVDDMVKGIVQDLQASGELDNTYVFLTGDNGWMQGEHRIPLGKSVPYEESMKQPLMVRGPGIAPGTHVSQLALNTDLYSTFSEIAGVPQDRDGRSLMPLLRGESPSGWRNQILLEKLSGEGNTPDFFGVRTEEGYKYVEYKNGEKELYYLKDDPYELESQHNKAESAPLIADLKVKLEALKSCSGQTCREAEDAP